MRTEVDKEYDKRFKNVNEDVILYIPIYSRMCSGNFGAALLLKQIQYWHEKYGIFYKFRGPCNNPFYKLGQSWLEELQCSRSQFDSALKKIGQKVPKGGKKRNNIFVYYWTNSIGQTFYDVNKGYITQEYDKSIEQRYNIEDGMEELKKNENLSVTTYENLIKNSYIKSSRIIKAESANHSNKPSKIAETEKLSQQNRKAESHITKTTTKNTFYLNSKAKALQSDAEASQENGQESLIKKKLPKILPKINKATSCSSKNSLNPADRKANIAKQKKPKKPGRSKKKITYSPTDLRNFSMLVQAGATNHKETDQTYYDTMDKISMLFSDKYDSPLIGASNLTEELYDYTWDIDEVVEIFEHYLKYAVKKNKNVGNFIFTEKNKYNTKSYSPLINWADKIINGDNELSDKSKNLYKNLKRKIEKTNSKLNIDSFNKVSVYKFNNASVFIEEVENKYEVVTPIIGVLEKFQIMNIFTNFIVKKMVDKGEAWMLERFITTTITQEDFIKDMIKGGSIRKKKKRGFDLNKKLAD